MNKQNTQAASSKKNAPTATERDEKIADLKERVRKGTYVLRTEIVIDEILSEGLLAYTEGKAEK